MVLIERVYVLAGDDVDLSVPVRIQLSQLSEAIQLLLSETGEVLR